MSKELKKVLILTYEFPPMGGIGSIWVAKFVKYLPRFGWRPVVVTVDNPPSNILDGSLEKEIPLDTEVIRTFSLEPNRLLRLLRKIRAGLKRKMLVGNEDRVIYSYTGMRLPTLARLKSLFIPDEKIGWLPFALLAALKTARRQETRAIFSTGPPYTTNLIGLICSRITGIPWVCEFKDPWVDNPVDLPAGKLNRKAFLALESLMVSNADAVVCAMPAQVEWLENRFGERIVGKCYLITNGFDADDYDESPRANDKFTITFMGKVYRDMYPRYLLGALEDLVKEGQIDENEVLLRCIGPLDVDSHKLFKEEKLGHLIETTGYIDHAACIKLMQTSHLLLLQLREGEMSRVIYTAKMFEYFGARLPILALAGEGSTAELIRHCNAGVVVNPNDREGIKIAVLRYYLRYKAGEDLRVDNPCLVRYEKKTQAGMLAEVFDAVSETRAAV